MVLFSHNGGYFFGPLFQTKLGSFLVPFGSFFSGKVQSCKGNSARHSTCASALPFLPNFFRCPLSSQIYTPMQWSEAKGLIFFFSYSQIILGSASNFSCSLFPTRQLIPLRSIPHNFSIVIARHTLHS